MAKYIIYFNQQWVGDHPEEWFIPRGPLSRAVVEEMKAAGVLVFAGGLVEEIEEAFERINDETFGVCVSCREAGRPAARSMIPKTRLREIPYARNCVECERKREEHR